MSWTYSMDQGEAEYPPNACPSCKKPRIELPDDHDTILCYEEIQMEMLRTGRLEEVKNVALLQDHPNFLGGVK